MSSFGRTLLSRLQSRATRGRTSTSLYHSLSGGNGGGSAGSGGEGKKQKDKKLKDWALPVLKFVGLTVVQAAITRATTKTIDWVLEWKSEEKTK
jgi:hypothetical protein